MAERELTQTYIPNPALRAIYRRFFDKIQVDEAWATAVRDLAARGSVIYVLRNLNFIDFLALDYLTKRYALPQIRFVNDLGLWILNPLGKGWLNALLPRKVSPREELEDALDRGGSAALFLKRPPGVMSLVASGRAGSRGLREGDDLGLAGEVGKLLPPVSAVWMVNAEEGEAEHEGGFRVRGSGFSRGSPTRDGGLL